MTEDTATKARVLVVDDQPANIRLLEAILAPRGYEVATATSGEEALETIAGLRKVVDQFFDGVMVMAEVESVRSNRLALLAELLREFTTVADFSEIGGEERR